MRQEWTAGRVRRAADRYDAARTSRDPWGSQYVRDLDEARDLDLDPNAVPDGTEDVAELAASVINSVGAGGWGERGEPSARDAWLTLQAAERALNEAARRHSDEEW